MQNHLGETQRVLCRDPAAGGGGALFSLLTASKSWPHMEHSVKVPLFACSASELTFPPFCLLELKKGLGLYGADRLKGLQKL